MLIKEAIIRNDIVLIDEPTLEESRSRRMALYKEWSNGDPIAAYVNVGGGVASMGPLSSRQFLLPGLNLAEDLGNKPGNGVAFSMAKAGIPVIHLLRIRELAKEYGLPIAPVPMPRVGEALVYEDEGLAGLTAGFALTVLAASIAVARFDLPKRVIGKLALTSE